MSERRKMSRSDDCDICKDVPGDSSSESECSSDCSGSSGSDGRRRHNRNRSNSSRSSYSSESERDWSETEFKAKGGEEIENGDGKTEDNEIEQNDPLAAKSRAKRDTTSHGNNRHRRDGHHGNKKRHGWKMTKVTMPTGKKFFITKPDMEYEWKCGKKTRMYTLKPDGYHGKREHNIVMKELEKTMMDIPGAAGRGGVYKKYNIVKLQKLVNPCLWRRYRFRQGVIRREVGFVNERMLFHGSVKAGEIAGTGFDECYSNPNGVYGAGLYFAHNSSAANEYTFGILGGNGCPTHKNKNCYDCERQMLLCRVTLGKQYKNDASIHHPHPPIGHHSVLGRNGPTSYYEYVIYRGEQAYPEYLITYKIAP